MQAQPLTSTDTAVFDGRLALTAPISEWELAGTEMRPQGVLRNILPSLEKALAGDSVELAADKRVRVCAFPLESGPEDVRAAGQKMAADFGKLRELLFTQSTLEQPSAAMVSEHFSDEGKLERRNSYVLLRSGATILPVSFTYQNKSLAGIDTASAGKSSGLVVDYVTGSCLWSTAAAVGLTVAGTTSTLVDPSNPLVERLQEFRLQSTPTLYEIESLQRLSRTINALSANDSRHRDVYLNVPDTEYKVYFLEALADGLISPEQFSQWCKAVDERSQWVREQFQVQLRPGLGIKQISALDPIVGFVAEFQAGRRLPVAEDLHTARGLLKAASSHWEGALAWQDERLRDRGRVFCWQDVNRLGYSMAQLMAANTSTDPGKVVIAVDNRHERPILELGERLNRHLKIPNRLIGAFSHELIASTESGAPKFNNLYFVQQEPRLDELQALGLV